MSRQEIVEHIWREKYRYVRADGSSTEMAMEDTINRVVNAVYAKDKNAEARKAAYDMMHRGDFVPGGRILAGAGTDRKVTLINCYVSQTIPDDLDGIFETLKQAAKTMQQGGGIGMDFSTIRPNGALVKQIDTEASGPLYFMDTWDAMCKTIQSSGARRGAMMATIRCDHPDVWHANHFETVEKDGEKKLANPSFISAKREKGRLTQFNVSVLVTDAFMKAVLDDADWDLGFHIPRADGRHVDVLERDGKPWYVYTRVKARTIWNDIITNTYEFAEPGVIFIDRVNGLNNLWYAEYISATNPCGEQPLPPFGACNLGAVNVANFVLDPFTEKARIDEDRLKEVVAHANRFLDNVLDITNFPLPEQQAESQNKRRTGLGVMGLGNMLMKLGVTYGEGAVPVVEKVMAALRNAAYEASAKLAVERGAFPLFDKEKFLQGAGIKKLPKRIRDMIAENGIRNGVLLTIAPTGTTAMFAGNVSGGLEPSFSFRYFRKVTLPDGSKREFAVMDKGWIDWCEHNGYDPVTQPMENLPEYMVTALTLSVEDHLAIQAACQKYIDSSISKTINCPMDMKFEDFRAVYQKAYEAGCKGCTTYRPSPVRGSVLSTESETAKKEKPAKKEKNISSLPRERTLVGKTYKETWPHSDNVYITINDIITEGDNGNSIQRPYEIFIQPNSPANHELAVAVGKCVSALMRVTDDIGFLVEGLKTVQSPEGGTFWRSPYAREGDKSKMVPSLVSLFAHVLESHIENMKGKPAPEPKVPAAAVSDVKEDAPKGEKCPKCAAPSLIRQEGCKTCTNCGYSQCG